MMPMLSASWRRGAIETRFKYANVGLAGCGVNTSVPGVYPVVFSVQNSAGINASVVRNITVLTSCPIGEQPCADGVACSAGGSCVEDLEAGVVAAEAAPPPPPTLTLRTTGALGKHVNVAKGITYDVCAAGVQPTAQLPCELGATAAAGVDVNLTALVLVCPPASCVKSGVGCAGHTMAQKGLQGCGINISKAAVGDVLTLNFLVFDDQSPRRNATATRTLTVISPCASDEFLCDDDTCSTVACELRDALALVDDSSPPAVTLRHTALRVEYLTSTPVTGLTPCATAAAFQAEPAPPYTCWASAVDLEDGDVSSSVTVAQDTLSCGACVICALEDASAGRCAPGRYFFLFQVTDDAGFMGTARLEVSLPSLIRTPPVPTTASDVLGFIKRQRSQLSEDAHT
jgi:hypothetical protein